MKIGDFMWMGVTTYELDEEDMEEEWKENRENKRNCPLEDKEVCMGIKR